MKTKENKSRRRLLILLGNSIFVIIGTTLAYFTTSDTFINVFKIPKYEPQVVEVFESPDNWVPGTTTKNEVKVTNNGNIDIAIRATYEEKWISENGDNLPLNDFEGNFAAIISFNDSWIKNSDGYYYYGSKENLTKLSTSEVSSSFINSVTFNKNIKASLTKTESADGKTITYESTGASYDGAKYTLTIKIDTIQYDQANNVW